MSQQLDGRDEIVKPALSGYPAGMVFPLFVSVHADWAIVLLEGGTPSHSYPYCVMCEKVDGEWQEGQSANFSGWFQTEDDLGVVVFWDDLGDLSEPVHVGFNGRLHPAEVACGYVFAAFWDSLDPANYIEPNWPEIVR
jgi:hypothetical protein